MRPALHLALLVAIAGAAGCGDGAHAPLRFWAMGREGEVVRD